MGTLQFRAGLMHLAPYSRRPAGGRKDADGTPWPATSGATAYCLNGRERGDGVLVPCEKPRLAATCSDTPAWGDVRDEGVNLFTRTESGRLEFFAAIDQEGHGSLVGKAAGSTPCAVADAAQAGEFSVALLADGSLHYHLWNPDRKDYITLGAMPDIPRLRLVKSEESVLSQSIGEIDFGTTVADLRQGVPPRVARATGEAASAAFAALRRRAVSAGLRTEPAVARLVARLWDGSLLHVGAPVLLEDAAYSVSRRVTFGLRQSSGGYTGTSAAVASLPAFRLRAVIEGRVPRAWHSVIRGFEVWVSREQEIADGSSEPEVTAYGLDGQGEPRLAVRTGVKASAPLAMRLTAEPMLCMAAVGAEMTPAILPLTARRTDVSAPWLDCSPMARLRATAIAGHGGFLHLGGVSRGYAAPEAPLERGTGATARVTVRLALPGGLRSLTAEYGVAKSRSVGPLIWYGSRDAVDMTVSVSYDGRHYSRTFLLDHSAGDEDASQWVSDGLEPVELPEVASLPEAGESEVWSRDAGLLLTSRRGNPLVVSGRTAHSGSDVMMLAARAGGGGAFTRQYLYAFGRSGVMAVTHDTDGRHTAARPLSLESVTGAGRVASGRGAVWALTDAGDLLRIDNASVSVPLRGLSPAGRLAYQHTPDELLIIPESGKPLAIACGSGSGAAGLRGSLRGESPGRPLPGTGGRVFSRRYGDVSGFYLAEGGGMCRMEWRGNAVARGISGPVAVTVDAEADAADAEVTLGVRVPCSPCGAPSEAAVARFAIEGPLCGPVSAPALLPVRRSGPEPMVWCSFSGLCPALRGITLSEVSPSVGHG